MTRESNLKSGSVGSAELLLAIRNLYCLADDWTRLGFEKTASNGRRFYRGVTLRLAGER